MKKSKLLTILILLTIVLIGAGVATYAWLTDTGSGSQTYTLGKITYAISGYDTNKPIVVPGQELLGDIELTNSSTVSSSLRVKLEVKQGDTEIEYGTVNTAAGKPLVYTANTGWTYNEDGYFYYGSKEANEGLGTEILTTNTDIGNFISSLFFNGYVVGNSSKGLDYTFTITFQAKQYEYVTWTNIATFDFTTGLAS